MCPHSQEVWFETPGMLVNFLRRMIEHRHRLNSDAVSVIQCHGRFNPGMLLTITAQRVWNQSW